MAEKKKKTLILTQWLDKSKAKKVCISSLKLRETGKIQFRFHIKPFMVRKQGKEKEASDFNRASCCFLDFIYNFGGIFCILGKKGIFYAEAKIKPFIKMLSFLDPRLEKQDSRITLGSYVFSLEAHRRRGAVHSGQL